MGTRTVAAIAHCDSLNCVSIGSSRYGQGSGERPSKFPHDLRSSHSHRSPGRGCNHGCRVAAAGGGNGIGVYIDSGRVVLGVLGSGAELGVVQRQFGTVEGPCWLDAPTAILNVPSAVDAVTQTDVLLRRLPIKEFRAWLSDCSAGVQSMRIDLG